MIQSIITINIIWLLFITYIYNITSYNSIYRHYIIIPYIKYSAYIVVILLLYIIIYYNICIDNNIMGYQYIYNYMGILWGIDGISLLLLSLLYIIMPIILLSNWSNIYDSISYYILIIVLCMLLSYNFICMDSITFYILFESSLLPLFLLINIYGSYNSNKASYYILLYTLYSSLYMLLSIVLLYNIYNSSDFTIMSNYILITDIQCIIYIGIMIGIVIKTPLWPFHLWLPLAHAESPIGGSIILAGIVLKIAIYAIIRLIIVNVSHASLLYIPIIYTICIITIIYIGLITIKQVDMKVIIAYSSIGHMAICIMGILSNNSIGIIGSLILSICHGIVSPALFIIVGSVLYDRYHNRLIHYYQSLSTYMPIMSIYLLLYSFINMSLPLSGNFIGELLSFMGAYTINPIITIISTISIILCATYQIKMTTKLLYGNTSIYMHITHDMTNKEIIMMNILIVPVLLIGIIPQYIINMISINCVSLLYIIV